MNRIFNLNPSINESVALLCEVSDMPYSRYTDAAHFALRTEHQTIRTSQTSSDAVLQYAIQLHQIKGHSILQPVPHMFRRMVRLLRRLIPSHPAPQYVVYSSGRGHVVRC